MTITQHKFKQYKGRKYKHIQTCSVSGDEYRGYVAHSYYWAITTVKQKDKP